MKQLKFDKPVRSNLAPKVADLIRNAIIQGEFKPNEKLNESRIATNLDLSKAPVREALGILRSENLVETRDRKGTFVKAFSDKDLEEIYTVLILIQCAAARLTVQHMNSEVENELKSIIKRTVDASKKKKISIKEIVVVGKQFHEFLIRSSDHSLLMKISAFLRPQEDRYRIAAFNKFAKLEEVQLFEATNEHVEIGTALLMRDEDKAEKLMKTHIKNGYSRIQKALQK